MRATIAAAAVLAQAGCGSPSQEDQVRSTLKTFAAAVADKDYERICNDLLAQELVSKVTAVGLSCPDALSRGLGSAQRPTLKVLSVKVRSDKLAMATVRTGAANQRPSTDSVRVVKEKGSWRIGSLSGSPAGGAP